VEFHLFNLKLKHLLPYKDVFSVWIESNYGEALLTPQHWYAAEHIMKFLELFYDATCVLSGVYYPTTPLMMHHILDFAEHLHKAKNDDVFRSIATPMKLKFFKYWENIPLLYSYAFILDPRAKMKGFFNVLELLTKHTGTSYTLYYFDVKDEMTRLFSNYEQKFSVARFEIPPCLVLLLVKGSRNGKISMVFLVLPLAILIPLFIFYNWCQ